MLPASIFLFVVVLLNGNAHAWVIMPCAILIQCTITAKMIEMQSPMVLASSYTGIMICIFSHGIWWLSASVCPLRMTYFKSLSRRNLCGWWTILFTALWESINIICPLLSVHWLLSTTFYGFLPGHNIFCEKLKSKMQWSLKHQFKNHILNQGCK